MKRIFFASAVFTTGAAFGLVLAAMVALGLFSVGQSGPATVAGASGTPDITVTVSEHHINSLIQKQLGGSASLGNVQAKVEPGNVVQLTGNTSVAGISVPVEVQSQLLADNGGITVKIIETKVGNFPVNLDLSSVISGPISAAAKSMLPLDRYRVSGVNTESGSVVIELIQR